MHRSKFNASLLCLVLGTCLPDTGLAETPAEAPANEPASFRVEIEVRDAAEKQLLDRHLIVFDGGKIYDFALSKPHDVTVYDPAGGRVTLLSIMDQVKATIATDDVVAVSARTRVDAKQRGKQNELGIDAETEKTPTGYKTAFAGAKGGFQYEVTTVEPTSDGQDKRFAEFTDWACRMNLIRRMGPPPFARMNLAKQLATDGLLPASLNLKCEAPDQTREFVSHYRYSDQLRDADKQQVEQAVEKIALFREVPFQTFPR